jgi:hypothetical protein
MTWLVHQSLWRCEKYVDGDGRCLLYTSHYKLIIEPTLRLEPDQMLICQVLERIDSTTGVPVMTCETGNGHDHEYNSQVFFFEAYHNPNLCDLLRSE